MTRLKRVLINVAVLVGLLYLFAMMYGLYLSPVAAHESSERSFHYGPSDVVHTESYYGGHYFLCKYDGWFSCNVVERAYLVFWRFGRYPGGIENNRDKAVNYSMVSSRQHRLVYGIINDAGINRVEVLWPDGEQGEQTEFYEDMFLLVFDAPSDDGRYIFEWIRAYDQEDRIVFEEVIP